MTETLNDKPDWGNPLEDREKITLSEYLEFYSNRITQESEKLFVRDFLFPILGETKIKYAVPQYPFIDTEGKNRRIDFGLVYDDKKVALEVNGETYHAEGIIPNEMFDDNLNRQNEILNAGWFLLRYSYTQLQEPTWRKRVYDSLFYLLKNKVPTLLSEAVVTPNYLQEQVLDSLNYYRSKGWKKGIVILPTGTGKTYLSAFDSQNAEGRILFVVHRLDILAQSKAAFEKVYPNAKIGLLTGEHRENVYDSKILFASKDSLRNPETLKSFTQNEFDYIIVDEVHHGQAPTYRIILDYFIPNVFMLGLTATPDRMDRKDIFELFDYQKVYEYTLNDAIENGFLVPYTYYGLRDNIDYNNIRHNGNKYNVADLDRHLIIKERNVKIYDEYLTKGKGNKALGFCCSIEHADAMAKFFNEKGIPSVSITSKTANRDNEVEKFRNSEYTVAFTVDLFNEGVDFPDLRVLMFLRPTESKTIFFQQLGRGLRLCGGKDNVVVIDFIGNYKKANNIRKYLSKGSKPNINSGNGRVEKILYEYAPKCEVIFESEVEEILDNQDTAEREITKEDLIGAYYDLMEVLKRKPSQEDINAHGEFKMSKYLSLFGSWSKFLKEIGEHTEASYHFPQGTHLGHILYILYSVGNGDLENSYLKSEYVKFSGGYSDDIGTFQRQTKYKLQALMEIGLLLDFRSSSGSESFDLILSDNGMELYQLLTPLLKSLDFSFSSSGKTGDLSWKMNSEGVINQRTHTFLNKHPELLDKVRRYFFEMDALALFLKYLYKNHDQTRFTKNELYNDFFEAPFVKNYLDRNGIDKPTGEGAKRRVPLLINLLEALGVIQQGRSEIKVLGFVSDPRLFESIVDENRNPISNEISDEIGKWLEGENFEISEDRKSLLREEYGKDFLTDNYYLSKI
ncbi:DEAD/DEAH box helicase family protein [Christiangramia sp. ASW11-125]|uniref:DEAD/DEAH box helicase family protein n=1 Tax=Christiangramia sp. ASW11-125 TaxID=3400701 RepID=UPI003AAD2DD6